MKKNTVIRWILFFLFFIFLRVLTPFLISLIATLLYDGTIPTETMGTLNGHYFTGTVWVIVRETLSTGIALYVALMIMPEKEKPTEAIFWLWAILSVCLIGAAIFLAITESDVDTLVYTLAWAFGGGIGILEGRSLALKS